MDAELVAGLIVGLLIGGVAGWVAGMCIRLFILDPLEAWLMERKRR